MQEVLHIHAEHQLSWEKPTRRDSWGNNKSCQAAPRLQLPLGDLRAFSSFPKTAPVTHECFWVSSSLKFTLVPAPIANAKLILKLPLRRLSQLLHQSLHTRKTSVTEQENHINCVLKLPLWALHTNGLIFVFKISICYWKTGREEKSRCYPKHHNSLGKGRLRVTAICLSTVGNKDVKAEWS